MALQLPAFLATLMRNHAGVWTMYVDFLGSPSGGFTNAPGSARSHATDLARRSGSTPWKSRAGQPGSTMRRRPRTATGAGDERCTPRLKVVRSVLRG